MENFTNKSPDSADLWGQFEDGNDSELEGRLYAEIYHSNEVHDSGENFQDSIKTIEDIKNASKAISQNNQLELENTNNPSNTSDNNCSPRNDQTDLVSAEKIEVSSHFDKNLNLQKQVNLETQSNSNPMEDSNKIADKTVIPQEKSDKNNTPKQKTPKQKKNQTENGFTPNSRRAVESLNQKKKRIDGSPQVLDNSLSTPKSRKRTSEVDLNSGGKSSRKSLECNETVINNKPKNANRKSDGVMLTPVSLNSRKSCEETNCSPVISPATMAILFPQKSKEGQLKGIKKKRGGIKKKMKITNSKDNSKQSKKARDSTQEDEVIEIISSDSSDDFLDEVPSIVETPNTTRRKQTKTSENELPMWLDNCSDSDESILEVPIPPKPLPPLIDLNDSESVSSDSDDSSSDGIYDLNSKTQMKKVIAVPTSTSTSDSEDSSEDDSKVSKEITKVCSINNCKENSVEISAVDSVESSQENLRSRLSTEQSNSKDEESSEYNSKVSKATPEVISINNSTESSLENSILDSVESRENVRFRFSSEQSNPTDEDSDSSYSDFPADGSMNSIEENLVLNFTQIQKGAKSLEEIKTLRKEAVSAEGDGSKNVPATEYNEYVAPLNDLVEPTTSKASGSLTKKKSKKNKKGENSRKSSKEKTDEEYFFEPMSDKMKAFYDDSWGGEEFSVEETQNQMRKDPRCWAILDDDWNPRLKRQRYFLNKTKCTLCRQHGHLRANCTEPKKGPICHMCGAQGHYETRCPHKICLTCGTKQNTFRQTCELCMKLFCTLCRSQGHSKDSCPDLWRQYHHTTSEAEHQSPKSSSQVMKSSNSLFCCNCTMQGHESSTCKKYRWTQHYPTPSHITSYYKCSQMLPSSSSSKHVKVLNLTESPGKSSRNLITNIELETISDEDMSQAPQNDNSNPDKILFHAKVMNKLLRKIDKKFNKADRENNDRLVLSKLEGAKLEGLISGTLTLKNLRRLSHNMGLDICIKLIEGRKVVMDVTYYQFFTKRYLFKKLIFFWVRLSDEEKPKLKLNLPRNKEKLIIVLDRQFRQFDRVSGDIQTLYNEVESFTNEIREKQSLTKKEKKWVTGRKISLEFTLKKLVRLLFKNDCVPEKEALSNLRKLRENLEKNKNVSTDVYFEISYYYFFIFGTYRPPNLEEMVQNYLTSKEGRADRSSSNSFLSKSSEVNCIDEDINNQQHLDQEYNNEEHVQADQQHVDENYVHQERVPSETSLHQNRPPSLLDISPRNFPPQFYSEQSTSSPGCKNTPQKRNRRSKTPIQHQNRPPSLLEISPRNFPPQIYPEQSTSSPGCRNTRRKRNRRSKTPIQHQKSSPSLLEISPRNFPPQFDPEQSTSSPGYNNTPQRRNRGSNQFEFPADDFIPISNYQPSEFLEEDLQFNRCGGSRQYRKNPMHNLKTFDPRAPQTSDRLVSEASYLMKQALQLNLPQLTKAGIRLGDLINQNRLQRKHLHHFRNLINSQQKRGFR